MTNETSPCFNPPPFLIQGIWLNPEKYSPLMANEEKVICISNNRYSLGNWMQFESDINQSKME